MAPILKPYLQESLKRKHLSVANVVTIGKESNQIDESEILGLDEQSYLTYENQIEPIKDILQKLTLKAAKARGIGTNLYYRMKKKIKTSNYKLSKKMSKRLKICIT